MGSGESLNDVEKISNLISKSAIETNMFWHYHPIKERIVLTSSYTTE